MSSKAIEYDSSRMTRLPVVVALHFLPPLFVTAAYLVFLPLASSSGFPRIAALVAALLLAGMPVQLAVLTIAFRKGQRIEFRMPMRWWQFVLAVVVLFSLALGAMMLPLAGVSGWLREAFAWLPPLMQPQPKSEWSQLARGAVLFTLIAKLVVDGFLNPIVEEVYYRGFLLPRLAPLGWAAPVANTLAFTVAHVWQPWNWPLIVLMVLPLTLFTWWRKNFYPQMVVHMLINILGATVALAAFMG